MELKVGQRVKIFDAEYCRRHFEDFNTSEMRKYCGKVTKIIRIEERLFGCNKYYLDVSSGKNIRVNGDKGYYWSEECFELLDNPKTMDTE